MATSISFAKPRTRRRENAVAESDPQSPSGGTVVAGGGVSGRVVVAVAGGDGGVVAIAGGGGVVAVATARGGGVRQHSEIGIESG